MITEKEKLQIELDLLLNLEHVEAWTGSLGSLQQKSYVVYGDVIKMINKRRTLLKEMENEL